MTAYALETFFQSGKTVYGVIWDSSTGKIWRRDANIWEVFTSVNWANYAIPITELGLGGGLGTGHYLVAYPTQIDLTTIIPTEQIFQQVGGSPSQPTTGGGGDYIIGGGKSQGVNVSAIAGNLAATLNMSAAAGSEVRGAATAGTLSTAQMTTNLSAVLIGAYIGRVVIWTSGVLTGVAAAITAYAGAGAGGGMLTYSTVPLAPGVGDQFVIV